MFSPLDTRYFSMLKEFSSIAGEVNFVYFMHLWSLAYAECTNNETYLPAYENREELYRRVQVKEKVCKHQMVAVLQVLEEDFPDVVFHYGLTSEDIMHNARCTQVVLSINLINLVLKEVEAGIREFEKEVTIPILAHTHGQPATPVRLGPYLRGKAKYLNLVKPEFRLGGSNGQLTALRYASKMTDCKDLAQGWLKKIQQRIDGLEEIQVCIPNDRIGLLQIGPSNDATFLSGISLVVKMRSLTRALWDHCYRKILFPSSEILQSGSSAMPHKINPIDFENAEGCFSNAYHILLNSFESNVDSRGLRDLSNSVVNRQMIEGWVYLYLGLKSLTKGMSKSSYSIDRILYELRQNPECLTELLRYYMQVEEGRDDPYWDLKKNPPNNFDNTIKRMENWSVLERK